MPFIPINSNNWRTVTNRLQIEWPEYVSQDLLPSINNTFDIGSTSLQWQRIYANELVVGDVIIGAGGLANFDFVAPLTYSYNAGTETHTLSFDYDTVQNGIYYYDGGDRLTNGDLLTFDVDTETLTVGDPDSQYVSLENDTATFTATISTNKILALEGTLGLDISSILSVNIASRLIPELPSFPSQ